MKRVIFVLPLLAFAAGCVPAGPPAGGPVGGGNTFFVQDPNDPFCQQLVDASTGVVLETVCA